MRAKLYPRLVRFKDAYGHCDVSRNWAGDPRLAIWVATSAYVGIPSSKSESGGWIRLNFGERQNVIKLD
jgi:hypothetical protein